jgi:hypothetical protein
MRVDEIIRRKSKIVQRKRYTVKDPNTGEYVHTPQGVMVDVENFHKPSFRPLKRNHEVGDILGTIGDWLDLMGATEVDIAPARKKATQSAEYQKLIRWGFKDVSTPGEIAAGTITLRFEDFNPPEVWYGHTYPATPLIRRVHINGNIRTHRAENTYHAGRGTTFKPMTAADHPDMSAVDRLAGSMIKSLGRLVSMYRAKLLKAVLKTPLTPGDRSDN